MRLLATIALLLCVTPSWAQTPPAARFTPIDVIVDAGGTGLAAYQIEIIANGPAQIVGVEGGEPAAFHAAPYYDPAALNRNRIIIAAFSTGSELPSGATRVATVHMRQPAPADITYEIKLITAANAAGQRIEAKVSLHQGDSQ